MKIPKFQFHVLQGILPVDIHQLPAEIVAGITLAALAIPETMGYSKIAGMPVITGLYTMLIPAVLYALFGSSRHLVVGADSATAAIMASRLIGLADYSSPEYIAYAGLLALLVAGLLVLARLIRLGFLADFLSRTVLIGFLTGVGVQIALGQIPGMVGVVTNVNGVFSKLADVVGHTRLINPYTVAVTIIVLISIFGLRKISKKIPGALIAVIGIIIASSVFNLPAKGVLVLGTIPAGFPTVELPRTSLEFSTIQKLLPTALSMVVVILAQSAVTARAYAARSNEHFNENADLIGLALANAGAGISGTFVVNGSPTKTQMVDNAGGRSQLAQITMAAVVLLVLGFLTKPLAYLPEAVLAAVVFLIGIELIDIKGMQKLYAQRPNEFWVAIITAVAVIIVGVENGIIFAILLSLLEHTRRGYRPKNTLILAGESGHLYTMGVDTHAQILPGLIIYRFNHSLYYANSELFFEEVNELTKNSGPPVKWFCLDLSVADDIDFSASETLREIYRILNDKNIRFVLTGVDVYIQSLLVRYQMDKLIKKDRIFETISDVIEAYKSVDPHENSAVNHINRSATGDL